MGGHLKIAKITEMAQALLLGATGLGGVLIGVMDLLGFQVEHFKNPLTLILVLAGLIGINLALERISLLHRLDLLEGNQETEKSLKSLPPNARKHVVECLRYCGDIYAIRKSLSKDEVAFVKISDERLSEQRILLESFAKGILNVVYEETALAQKALVSIFRKRFEAISETDVDFWVQGAIAQDYLSANVRSIERYKTTVNRIFVLTISDLEHKRNLVASVLERQHRAGIGWGIAIAEELDLDVQNASLPRDFAIFDQDKAVSLFRKRDGRRFEAIFSSPDNRKLLAEYRQLYAKMVAECWMVSESFRSSFAEGFTQDLNQEIWTRSQNSNKSLGAMIGLEIGEAAPFVLAVIKEEDIAKKLETLLNVVVRYRTARGLEASV